MHNIKLKLNDEEKSLILYRLLLKSYENFNGVIYLWQERHHHLKGGSMGY